MLQAFKWLQADPIYICYHLKKNKNGANTQGTTTINELCKFYVFEVTKK